MKATAQLALLGLACGLALALPAWLASVWRQDASLADRFWGSFVALPALVYLLHLGPDPRSALMLGLIGLWALRLTVFVTARNWGHGEDRRYQAIRARNQPHFALKSLYLVFLLQALLAWVVGLPVLAAHGGAPWGGWDTLGALVATVGLLIEATADAQLARFRRRADARQAVMDEGLWRYSRHPNYFGEACLWWGLGLMALSASGWAGAWALVSPLMMTVLLLRVSGVSLLEQDIGERRPAYRAYIQRTSAFIPWPPRSLAP